jgi:hypothetical protein
MTKKPPSRNPRAKYRREAMATRRIGEGQECKCGESRTRALIPGSDPVICAKCDRKARGKSTFDDHHIAGSANSPVTIPTPVNDHRAELSEAQMDWPKATLENPARSPLLSGAAHIRGFVDVLVYLAQTFLRWIADMLETLDTLLEQKLGPNWWNGTTLGAFEPKT